MLFPLLGILLAAVLGGIVQSTVGFGSAIVMLIFIPAFLPLISCTAITTVASLSMCIGIAWRYRKHVQLSLLPLSLLAYAVFATIGIRLSLVIDAVRIKLVFGIFLIVLACYLMFISQKLSLHVTPVTALVCGTLSGISSGLFGIGGPPMALFFLAAIPDDKYGYLGTAQCFFLITGTYSTVIRLASGIITPSLLPYMVSAVVGILAGTWVGGKILDKINTQQMRKLVYLVLALSGMLTVYNAMGALG